MDKPLTAPTDLDGEVLFGIEFLMPGPIPDLWVALGGFWSNDETWILESYQTHFATHPDNYRAVKIETVQRKKVIAP